MTDNKVALRTIIDLYGMENIRLETISEIIFSLSQNAEDVRALKLQSEALYALFQLVQDAKLPTGHITE